MSVFSTFWTNTIWYIALGILTVVEMAFILVKVKRRNIVIAFFLTVFGITLFVESTILIFMKSYSYFPMILDKSRMPYDDVLAGNLFSQFSISATLLLAAVFDLQKYWYFIFAVLYGFIEELFLYLGIYSHNWYRTWMTIIMLPVAFWFIKFIYANILKGVKPILYYGYIILGLFPLNIVILNWFFMLTGLHDMSLYFLADPIRSRHMIVLIMFFPLSISMMAVYFSRMKVQWKGLIVVVQFVLYYIAYSTKFFVIKEGWFPMVSTTTIAWMYLSILLLDRLFGEPHRKVIKN